MSLSKPASPIAKRRRIDREFEDYFPILSLPNELISLVFSSLPIKDRMRLRVNKKLNAIELDSKYFVEKLHIFELPNKGVPPRGMKPWRYKDTDQNIIFYKDNAYSSDCIRRIAMNASVGELKIELDSPKELHYDVYNLIKNFNIGTLRFGRIWDMQDDVITPSYFLHFARTCRSLDMSCINDYTISAKALHQVYKGMMDRSMNLRDFVIGSRHHTGMSTQFLKRIGITILCDYNPNHHHLKVLSKRDIEVFKYKPDDDEDEEDEFDITRIIFDGFLEIHADGFDDTDQCFRMKLHETQESLEKAKNNENIMRIKLD